MIITETLQVSLCLDWSLYAIIWIEHYWPVICRSAMSKKCFLGRASHLESVMGSTQTALFTDASHVVWWSLRGCFRKNRIKCKNPSTQSLSHSHTESMNTYVNERFWEIFNKAAQNVRICFHSVIVAYCVQADGEHNAKFSISNSISCDRLSA